MSIGLGIAIAGISVLLSNAFHDVFCYYAYERKRRDENG